MKSKIKACALAAAFHTLFPDATEFSQSKLLKAFPILDAKVRPPCSKDGCPASDDTLYSMVIHLNDTHMWTREAIALWISTIEDGLEQSMKLSVDQAEKIVDSAFVKCEDERVTA